MNYLDLYTNRPFSKVFAAVDKVEGILRPLWTGAENPFPEEIKGGPNISRGALNASRP